MSDPSLLAGLDIGGSKVLAVALELSGADAPPRVMLRAGPFKPGI